MLISCGSVSYFSGEEQLNQYPGLTRGLVSVLLYYDGRKSLTQSLRTLIQGRDGLTWTLELPEDVAELISTFTGQLLEEGLVEKILSKVTRVKQVWDLFYTYNSATFQPCWTNWTGTVKL